jgi:hypothetical protein
MTTLRSLIASILLAAAATGCHSVPTPAKPAPVQVRLDRAQVKQKLAARRQQVFERFLAYREGRVYPVNPGPSTQHIWIDANGNLCAAATLISFDWGRDRAIAVIGDNLTIRLADVHTGPLADWILTSGLTHHEIVAIQLPGDDIMLRGEAQETERMYQVYRDVERQMRSMWDENLDDAVDALMARPDLARALISA